jgi:hypothetical protein
MSTATSARWALVEQGELRSVGRIETKPEALELFAQSLDCHDHVVLEVTGNAWAIARITEPHVARVIVVSPSNSGQLVEPRSGPYEPESCVLREVWRRRRGSHTACHAEGRGFESLQPLPRIRLYRASNSILAGPPGCRAGRGFSG